MNEKFRNSRGQEITFTDDNIVFGSPSMLDENEVFEQIIPYGRIKDIKFTKAFGIPDVDIIDKETVDGKQNIHYGYMYEMNQKDKLAEMIAFAKGRMKGVPSIEPIQPQQEEKNNVKLIDSLDFKYKNCEIRFGRGLFVKKIPVSSITTCEGMSYWKDIVFHKVKITFNAGEDRYIIEGRTYDAVKDIPFEEYYDNIVRDSRMSAEEKAIALNNKSYGSVELFAKGVASGVVTQHSSNTEKDASVVGRAVVGAAIAGETGAIVGALSAVDKNNKSKK